MITLLTVAGMVVSFVFGIVLLVCYVAILAKIL